MPLIAELSFQFQEASNSILIKFKISGDNFMKMITAIIKPGKLDQVHDELIKNGVQGMTVSEVKGFGRQKGHKEIYRGAEYEVTYIPKVKIEVVVNDDQEENIIEAISLSANTDSIGDGKIFVSSIGNAVRIRTGEAGSEAL